MSPDKYTASDASFSHPLSAAGSENPSYRPHGYEALLPPHSLPGIIPSPGSLPALHILPAPPDRLFPKGVLSVITLSFHPHFYLFFSYRFTHPPISVRVLGLSVSSDTSCCRPARQITTCPCPLQIISSTDSIDIKQLARHI